jgi:hypothetical protein
MSTQLWPSLPLEEWEDSKITLHLYCQIVGKIRLALTPRMNHWWNVTLYVSSRGLTTGPIPYGDRIFEMELDFLEHRLTIHTSDGQLRTLALQPRSVADFYAEVISALRSLGIQVTMLPKPFGVPMTTPFTDDHEHAAYNAEYVNRFWWVLVEVDGVFKEFRARFIGKCSPVHVFWHSLDLAVTRFSGRPAPAREGADAVTREAYSHEVISAGFWAGDANVRAPAFYCYTAPEPQGLTDEPLRPASATWQQLPSGSMAMLRYDDVRQSADPREAVLDFLQSTYEAGARRAKWDRKALER